MGRKPENEKFVAWVPVRDKSGDMMMRCKRCEEIVPFNKTLIHKCPKSATGISLED